MTVERSPLAGLADRFSQTSCAAFDIRERPLWHQLNLRLDPAGSRSAALVLGATLPTRPNTVAGCAFGLLVWLGPNEWLLLSPTSLRAVEQELGEALGDVSHSLVDVSAARTVISLAGPSVRSVLAHGCALDLDAAAFRAGTCAQTKLALANVIILAVPEQPGDLDTHPEILVLVRSSFAPYLATWLLDAATEYVAAGPSIGTDDSARPTDDF